MTTRDFSAFFERYGWPAGKGQLPFCIGHRGASGHKTENTLAAFELASELGAEMWELDTQLTQRRRRRRQPRRPPRSASSASTATSRR